MDPRDFARAIIDAWDDPMPRLVFADYLEERGQPDRAAMLRHGATVERIQASNFHTGSRKPADELWERCRPDWWVADDLHRVSERPDRGLIALYTSARKGIERLSRVPWLPQAIADGWLGSITHLIGRATFARVVANRRGPIRDVPLAIAVPMFVEPDQRADEVIDRVLDLPNLVEFCCGPPMTSAQHRALADHAELRSFHLNWHRIEPGDRPAVVAAIARMTGLRELQIDYAHEMTDDELAPLAALTRLGRLTIRGGNLTDRGLAHLHALTGLRHLDLGFLCPGLTANGLDRLRAALPTTDLHGLRVYRHQ